MMDVMNHGNKHFVVECLCRMLLSTKQNKTQNRFYCIDRLSIYVHRSMVHLTNVVLNIDYYRVHDIFVAH